LCSVMQVSRRGYYDWLNRLPSAREVSNQCLLVEIKRVFYAHREVYGAPRVYRTLIEEGHYCGLNRVARLMQKAGLIPKTVKKFRAATDSRKSHRPAPNLLARDFSASRPNEKWVADVTYVPTREGWLLLAVVLDLFSRRVVGWSMSERLTSELAQQALLHAVEQRSPGEGLLVHSDRGKEYYANDYQVLLKDNGLVCSMSRLGNCYDNAAMESFFHSLKVEQVHHDDYRTRDEARSAIFEYIEIFYNRQRKHSTIGYQSPVAFEESCVA
jgi:putative transposase